MGCLSEILGFIMFLIVLTIVIKAGLFNQMSGSLGLFDQLMQEVFKSMISIMQTGDVYQGGTSLTY